MNQLDVVGVRVEMPSNQPIVLLRERDGERYLPIWIGAVEATAIGTIMVQARGYGTLTGNLEALRTTLRSHLDVREYKPQRAFSPAASAESS